MADRTLLNHKLPRRRLRRIVTIFSWTAFLLGNVLLLAIMDTSSVLAGVLLLVLLIVCEASLLAVYWRQIGQWRAIILFWLVYSLARVAATWLSGRDVQFGVSVAIMVTLYSVFAGWMATIILAIRRDVGVAYLAIVFSIAPILLRAQVNAFGSVLAWLQRNQPNTELSTFTVMDPIVMAMFCMVPVALFTIIPHFIWLWVKERRRQPIKAQEPEVDFAR